jgi:hypothetical protein
MKNRNDISCKEVQELLLDKNSGELPDSLKAHLETCQNCREFQNMLTEISNSTQLEENLKPDPKIVRTLRKEFKKQTISTPYFGPIIALFQKRIPVYQVVMAMFIAAIFYFTLIKIDISKPNPEGVKLTTQIEEQTIQSAEFPTIPIDQDQQVGISLKEDSVLAKFRVSIL